MLSFHSLLPLRSKSPSEDNQGVDRGIVQVTSVGSLFPILSALELSLNRVWLAIGLQRVNGRQDIIADSFGARRYYACSPRSLFVRLCIFNFSLSLIIE